MKDFQVSFIIIIIIIITITVIPVESLPRSSLPAYLRRREKLTSQEIASLTSRIPTGKPPCWICKKPRPGMEAKIQVTSIYFYDYLYSVVAPHSFTTIFRFNDMISLSPCDIVLSFCSYFSSWKRNSYYNVIECVSP